MLASYFNDVHGQLKNFVLIFASTKFSENVKFAKNSLKLVPVFNSLPKVCIWVLFINMSATNAGEVQQQRTFSILKKGMPNLLVVQPGIHK